VVARAGFFKPLRLALLMTGTDSAAILAARFDHRMATANRWTLGGLAAMATGFGLYYTRVHRRKGPNDDATVTEGALAFGGLGALYVGLGLEYAASPLKHRAVWWYNRRFEAPAVR